MLLGDQPIRHILAHHDAQWSELADFKPYGRLHRVTLGGRSLHVLSLAHPRQVGGLGTHSEQWRQRHDTWKTTVAPKLF